MTCNLVANNWLAFFPFSLLLQFVGTIRTHNHATFHNHCIARDQNIKEYSLLFLSVNFEKISQNSEIVFVIPLSCLFYGRGVKRNSNIVRVLCVCHRWIDSIEASLPWACKSCVPINNEQYKCTDDIKVLKHLAFAI